MRTILAFLIVLLVPALAHAQAYPCGWAEDNERILRDKHHETPIASGYIDETIQFRIYASEDGKTWTAMIVTADGMACLVESGQHWKQAPIPKGPGT